MRIRITTLVAVFVALLLAGCGVPRFEEALPEPRPWFEVSSVDIDEGTVVVAGSLLESVPPTLTVSPGVPQHFVVGLYPGPSATGGDAAVEPDNQGDFTVTYDFGEPQSGIYILDFNKSEWGRQYLHVNLSSGEWAETDIW